jgi:glucose-1-phosphatase
MNRPKAVLFDLGKVLVDFDWMLAARRIAARSRLSPPELFDFIYTSDLMARYEKGQVSSEQFFQETRQAIGYLGSFPEFRQAFSDIFTEIPLMVDLHARVRAAGLPTFVFSNTNDFAVTHIRSHFPFFAGFTGYFLSYELGALKPEPGMYEAAERATGCAGAEILYLDDFAANVAAGAARGWQAILHVAPEQTIPQVERRLAQGRRE